MRKRSRVGDVVFLDGALNRLFAVPRSDREGQTVRLALQQIDPPPGMDDRGGFFMADEPAGAPSVYEVPRPVVDPVGPVVASETPTAAAIQTPAAIPAPAASPASPASPPPAPAAIAPASPASATASRRLRGCRTRGQEETRRCDRAKAIDHNHRGCRDQPGQQLVTRFARARCQWTLPNLRYPKAGRRQRLEV